MDFDFLKTLKTINNDYGNIMLAILAVIGYIVALKSYNESVRSRKISSSPYLTLERSEETSNSDYNFVIDFRSDKNEDGIQLKSAYCLRNYGNGVAGEISFERFGKCLEFKINQDNGEALYKIENNILPSILAFDLFAPSIFGGIAIEPGSYIPIQFIFILNKDIDTNTIHFLEKYVFEVSYTSLSDSSHQTYIAELTATVMPQNKQLVSGFTIVQSTRGKIQKFKHAWNIS